MTIGAAAPAGGLIIGLSSNQSFATVPTSVTVSGGATSASFNVSTHAVAASGLAVLSATLAGQSASASLFVLSPSVLSVNVTPSTVFGSQQAVGTVTLNAAAPTGGLTVQLSSNQTFAPVPASVTVAHGATQATFSIYTTPVLSNGLATITAGAGGLSTTCQLSVLAPAVVTLTATPNPVVGGYAVTGAVAISVAAPSGGWTIAMSSNQSFVTFPYAVKIPAGDHSTTFTIRTAEVGTPGTAALTASAGGITAGTSLSVLPPALTSVTLSSPQVYGGSSATGTVSVNLAAPSGGETVQLSSDSGDAQVPATVKIPAGDHMATFTITTTSVMSNASVDISVSAGRGRCFCRLARDVSRSDKQSMA